MGVTHRFLENDEKSKLNLPTGSQNALTIEMCVKE
jgi:hypothetical protein